MSRLLPFLAALLSACAGAPEAPQNPVSTGMKHALGEEVDCDVSARMASVWQERGLAKGRSHDKLSGPEDGVRDILSRAPEAASDILSTATCGRVTPWTPAWSGTSARAATTYDLLLAARGAQQVVAAHAEPSAAALSARQAWMIANHLRHGVMMNQVMAIAAQNALLERELTPRLASLPPEERTRLLVPMMMMAKAPPSIADTVAVEADLAARAKPSDAAAWGGDDGLADCREALPKLAEAARKVEALPVSDRPAAWSASPAPGCEEVRRAVADVFANDAAALAKLNASMG